MVYVQIDYKTANAETSLHAQCKETGKKEFSGEFNERMKTVTAIQKTGKLVPKRDNNLYFLTRGPSDNISILRICLGAHK